MNDLPGSTPAAASATSGGPPGPRPGTSPPHGGPATGTRRLLRRLRDVMAASGAAQERLDRIVLLVAAEMVAEVCSIYVMRAGEVLELFATEGLRPEAVHRTRLRVGEGLVGVIAATARPLALADAQAHPDFAYRPETGEEIYHSLMGVPILRGGRVLGVLVVQNRTPRRYTDDEIEIAQTIAMIVAELIASGELVNPLEMAQSSSGALLPIRLTGVRLNEGLAIGPAVLHMPKLVIRQVVAEDIEAELVRLRRAVSAMQSAIDDLVAASRGLGAGEHRDNIETYRMFAADRGWLKRSTEAVRSGLTAEAAGQKIREETRTRMTQIADPYLRERLISTSKTLPTGCSISSPAGWSAARWACCRWSSSLSRIRWGRPSCSTMPIAGCAGWCWRRGRRPRMSRSSPALSTSRWSAGSKTPRAAPRPATSSSSMATTARCSSGRARTCSNRSSTRWPSGPGAAPITRRCATSRR